MPFFLPSKHFECFSQSKGFPMLRFLPQGRDLNFTCHLPCILSSGLRPPLRQPEAPMPESLSEEFQMHSTHSRNTLYRERFQGKLPELASEVLVGVIQWWAVPLGQFCHPTGASSPVSASKSGPGEALLESLGVTHDLQLNPFLLNSVRTYFC